MCEGWVSREVEEGGKPKGLKIDLTQATIRVRLLPPRESYTPIDRSDILEAFTNENEKVRLEHAVPARAE